MPATAAASSLAWKLLLPVLGAIVMGLSLVLWDGLREKITEGKADEAAVIELKKTNDEAHRTLSGKLNAIDSRTKRDGKVMRAVARKLRIEVPEPEPKEE